MRRYVAFDLLINMVHNQSNINHREVMTPARKAQNWLPSIFNDFFGNEWVEKRASSAPAVNIIETESAYKVEIAAPGMTRHDFRIDLNDNNELIVSMQKCAESGTPSDAGKQEHKGTYLRREFAYTQFRQSMILPDNVDKDHIEAKVENGILMIEIPKMKQAEKQAAVRQIDIK